MIPAGVGGAIRRLRGLDSRRDSLTNILFNLGLPSFDALLTNAAVTFARLAYGFRVLIVPSYAFRQLSLFSVSYLLYCTVSLLSVFLCFYPIPGYRVLRCDLAIACRVSVRLSVCDVGGLWSHRLKFFENNFTIS